MHLGYFTDFKSHLHLILLSSGDPDDFLRLQRHIQTLSEETALAIHALNFVAVHNGATLDVRLGSIERITCVGISSFEWSLTSDLRDEVVRKVKPLALALQGGHQVFECHPADDAVVMMSVAEYSDAWWHAQAANQARPQSPQGG